MVTGEKIFHGSLAAAEVSRDTKSYSGFMSGLFEGSVRRHLFSCYSITPMGAEAEEFVERLRLLLIQKVDPERIDRDGDISEDVIAAFREIGAFGIKIPKTYGGLGLSQSEYHTVATLLGSHDASTTVLISAHNSIGVGEPVKLVGDAAQKQRLLPRLANGEISGFALTEKDAGCDIWDLKAYAVPVKEHGRTIGYRLTADKLYTTNAPHRKNEFLA
ncbi:MAG TPA: acyl-CoA dehydrogenase family protein, partial [Nitrospirales bacterium]